MSLERAREKLVRRVVSPVEVLYAVSTHWWVMLVAIGLGFLVMLAKVLSDPPVFECSATMVISPNEVSIEQDPRRAPSRASDAAMQTFIAEQLSLLQGDSVIEKVALQIGDEPIMQQDEEPEEGRERGFLARIYGGIERGALSFLERLQRHPEGTLTERLRQKAKASFRLRSYVLNQPKSNIVKLGVMGTRRDRLKDELLAWIEAYRARIDEISEETYEMLFSERIDHWIKQEKEAKQKLDRFKSENPDVSVVHQEANRQNILRLQMLRYQLLGNQLPVLPLTGGVIPDFRSGGPAGPGVAPVPEDAVVLQLKRAEADKVVELAGLRERHPPQSDKVRSAEAALRNLQAQIQRRQSLIPEPDPVPEPDTDRGADERDERFRQFQENQKKELQEGMKARDEFVERRVKQIDEELHAAIADQARMDEKIAEMNVLAEAHKRASEIRWQFQTMQDQQRNQVEARKVVNIQVHDKPVVSVEPMGNRFQKVMLGTAAGVGLGLFLTFTMELFSRRVRHKKDVEDDLGLMVVGVIPEKRP